MGLICNCPEGTALPNVPISNCPESMGQIQKVVFQRIFSAGTTKNKIADPTLLASWTPLLSAADGTKAVQSPYIQNPQTEPGAPKTYGGGNETLGGIPIIIGSDPTSFKGNILRTSQKTIKALKAYMCENVGVYLIDANGNIGCQADDINDPSEYYPIPVVGLFVGDKTFGGFEAPDMNGIQWSFYPNWSDNFVIVTPSDFAALTDLATPAS